MIYVARHGETDWNRTGRYQGQRDESRLTETGHAQAAALASALAPAGVTRVIASPLTRCLESAAPLAARLRVDVEVDRDLIEIAHGTWEGRVRADIEREEPAAMRVWREQPQRARFVGGESLDDVAARWRRFAQGLGAADGVAIVTHDVIVRLAIVDATGEPLAHLWEPRVVNGGYACFRGGGSWELVAACVDAHLGEHAVDIASQAL